ncbi:PBSX family phage terminase large subunit [Gottfriedia acidiceleris]|uniref:PBSX family phage terminase large subunit n=1 Tax=Gottfriedia acidiceleris TaxID=371036 RepID=UPI0030004603
MIEKEVNPHFEDFIFDWEDKYYFLVGGYGSSKSYHVALKTILKLLEEKRIALVVREVYDTIRDSCFALFADIADELGLYSTRKEKGKIQFTSSPMQIKFPNGSKIIFKGMDRPEKLKSVHNVSIVWLEECSEAKYAGYKELTGRLRHPTLKTHIILSTNPVGKSNWSYKHFFKNDKTKYHVLNDKDLYKQRIMIVNKTYYHHSTADDNLFLPEDYIEQLDDLKNHDPDLHRIARHGEFGTNGVKVLPQFIEAPHEEVMEQIKSLKKPIYKNGMDFGFVSSYNALLRLAIDHDEKILYIYWEYYKNQQTDDQTAEDIKEFKESGELIKADAAEPKTIAFFKQNGFKMKPGKKFAGSRLQYTKKVKRFKKIICSSNCVNTIDELKDLTFAVDKQGEIIEDEFNIDPHTFSAIWYALDDYEVSDLKGNAVRSMNKSELGL